MVCLLPFTDSSRRLQLSHPLAIQPVGVIDWAQFMAHVEVFWQSEGAASAVWGAKYGNATNNTPYINPNIVLDARTVVNARVGIENVAVGGGTLRSSLWVRNAFDEDYPTFGINFGTLGPITEQYGDPRTYGLDVTWEF